MDNQHKKIKGYRDLSEEEIALMNEAKELAEEVGAFCDKVADMSHPSGSDETLRVDARWFSIGRTDLQKGFMSLIRSIAQPTTF